jgi:hypothetical protein
LHFQPTDTLESKATGTNCSRYTLNKSKLNPALFAKKEMVIPPVFCTVQLFAQDTCRINTSLNTAIKKGQKNIFVNNRLILQATNKTRNEQGSTIRQLDILFLLLLFQQKGGFVYCAKVTTRK